MCQFFRQNRNKFHFKSTLFSSGASRPSMPELLHLKVPERVGQEYFKFGVLLLNDGDGSKMDDIKGSDNTMRMILKEWLRGQGESVTWKTLIDTLRACKLSSLATDVEARMNGKPLYTHILIWKGIYLYWCVINLPTVYNNGNNDI